MSKDANSFGHDKALAWESRGFVYTKKRMHRFDTPSQRVSGVFSLLHSFEVDKIGFTELTIEPMPPVTSSSESSLLNSKVCSHFVP